MTVQKSDKQPCRLSDYEACEFCGRTYNRGIYDFKTEKHNFRI